MSQASRCLPALITVLNPTGEAEPIGYKRACSDRSVSPGYRVPVIVGTLAVAVLGAPLLYYLTFDFDPIHLRSPKTESISTLLDLGGDPRAGINSVNVITAVARRGERRQPISCGTLPQVSQAKTLLSFVPQDQDKKLATYPGPEPATWPGFAEARLEQAADRCR